MTWWVSLLAGLAVAFSPCVFPTLPVFLVYIVRSRRSPVLVTAAFSLGLSLSLAAYAFAVAAMAEWAVALAQIPMRAATRALAVLLVALAVVELSPLRRYLTLPSFRALALKHLDVAGAFMAGALMSLLAAPCAASALLAWTVTLAQAPSAALVNLIAFLAGASAPYVLIGLTAASVGPQLHKRLAKSALVRYSHVVAAIALILLALLLLL